MNNGLYPPSLQFRITYVYGMQGNHNPQPYTVSVTGCDEEYEVKFVIDVFEPPDTPGTHGSQVSLSLCVCVCKCMCVPIVTKLSEQLTRRLTDISVTNTQYVYNEKGYICGPI